MIILVHTMDMIFSLSTKSKKLNTTLKMIFSITYYLKLLNDIFFIVYLIFLKHMSSWLFGH